MVEKSTKVLTKRKKFQSVEIPLTNSKVELIGNSIEDLKDKTIKLDLTRQLKGKSVEAIGKIRLMPYFIKRMIRKRISYVEDSFETPSQENMIIIKPFLITRKKVSRAVRKALRNRTKNWVEDYIAERTNDEIFNEILSNKMQRSLSLILKKTYPLSLCEIRILEIKRPLEKEEIPKIKKKEEIEQSKPLEEEIIDQVAELEKEKKEKAEKEIKKTQEKAVKVEKAEEKTKKKTSKSQKDSSKKEKKGEKSDIDKKQEKKK
jgi:ribosomal protein S3AE